MSQTTLLSYEELITVQKIAGTKDEEIMEHHPVLRQLLFIRRQYAIAYVTQRANSVETSYEYVFLCIKRLNDDIKKVMGIF